MYIIVYIMVSKLFNPSLTKELSKLGERIRLARLRRNLSMSLVCERADLSRPTLTAIESGDPGVSLGAYLSVLKVLSLSQDIEKVAKDDELGRKLQDLNLDPSYRIRAQKRTLK